VVYLFDRNYIYLVLKLIMIYL